MLHHGCSKNLVDFLSHIKCLRLAVPRDCLFEQLAVQDGPALKFIKLEFLGLVRRLVMLA